MGRLATSSCQVSSAWWEGRLVVANYVFACQVSPTGVLSCWLSIPFWYTGSISSGTSVCAPTTVLKSKWLPSLPVARFLRNEELLVAVSRRFLSGLPWSVEAVVRCSLSLRGTGYTFVEVNWRLRMKPFQRVAPGVLYFTSLFLSSAALIALLRCFWATSFPSRIFICLHYSRSLPCVKLIRYEPRRGTSRLPIARPWCW